MQIRFFIIFLTEAAGFIQTFIEELNTCIETHLCAKLLRQINLWIGVPFFFKPFETRIGKLAPFGRAVRYWEMEIPILFKLFDVIQCGFSRRPTMKSPSTARHKPVWHNLCINTLKHPTG